MRWIESQLRLGYRALDHGLDSLKDSEQERVQDK